MQVTALGLIDSQGKTGDVPTNVQFALKGGAVSVSFLPLLLHVICHTRGSCRNFEDVVLLVCENSMINSTKTYHMSAPSHLGLSAVCADDKHLHILFGVLPLVLISAQRVLLGVSRVRPLATRLRRRPVPLRGPDAGHYVLMRTAEEVRQVRQLLDDRFHQGLPQRLLREDLRPLPLHLLICPRCSGGAAVTGAGGPPF